MSSLTDTLISDTFDSIIHANANPIPISGLVNLYDGEGNQSSLSIGRSGNGIDVSGKITTDDLTVGNINFPKLNGVIGSIVYQKTATEWGYLEDGIGSNLLQSLSPSPAKTYTNPIASITVNSKGLVTNITELGSFRTSKNIVAHHSPHVSVTGSTSPIVLPASSNEWVRVDLTNDGLGTEDPAKLTASVIDETRSITGFLRSTGKVVHGGKQTFIQATPSPSIVNEAGSNYLYPVIYDIPVNADDQRGIGASFFCPVARETVGGSPNHAVIYLRNRGNGSTDVNATSWVLTITAQHT
jgi:hypothetical protein